MSTLIIGCGYLGMRVARRMMAAGHRVFATTRSRNRAELLAREGMEPILADVLNPESLDDLPAVERAFYCVGYDRSSQVPIQRVYVDGLRHTIGRLASRAKRLIYASSTGVYGDLGGDWVDEDTPADPQTESGRACLHAEHLLADFAKVSMYPVTILRYSGLYGPGRLMRREALRLGQPIAADPESYLNLVHIDDAASAAVLALRNPRPGPRYLVSDDRPILRREFYECLAEALGGPPPTFTEPSDDGPIRGNASKRVSNRRIKSELNWTLQYPDITTGIPASLTEESPTAESP
ncbi:SDR family oxidoreductase [Tautonia marina]|uniref:SDR family oxidoreductase n=1 Tax=Tautonia marina TaxID=2653855 RepID=UPI0012608446|nr:SDR family oxidoreductase [Tautonia marina]